MAVQQSDAEHENRGDADQQHAPCEWDGRHDELGDDVSTFRVDEWQTLPTRRTRNTEKQDRASNKQRTSPDLTGSATTSTAGEGAATGMGGLLARVQNN
jgi:hypothetical protein